MTITFSLTARDLVATAMEDRKILALGRDPTSKELAYGVKKLNLILKDLASKGVTPWRDEDGTAVFGVGVSSVTLSPRPVDVLDAYRALSGGQRRPMARWEQEEYSTLPNPAQSGTPIVFNIKSTPTTVLMRIWPVPTEITTIGYSYSRVIEDVTQPSDPLDIPQMWLEGMGKMLAAKLDAFGDGGDPMHLAKIMGEAAEFRRELLDHDRPASYTMERSC